MSFLRQLLIYGVAGAASRLIGVILVPLYTRALSLSDYGAFEVLLALYILLVALSGWQSESALARDFHEAKEEGWHRKLIWSAILISLGGFGLVAGLVALAMLTGIVPGEIAPYLPWLVILLLPTQWHSLQLIVLRFTHRPFAFAAFSLIDLVISAGASIYFITFAGLGIAGAFAGLLAGKLTVLVLAWGTTFGRFTSPLPVTETPRRMLRYGTPILVPVLLNWAQKYGGPLLLAILLTLQDVAIAGIALKIAAIFEVAALSFRQAWDPFAFARLNDPEAAQPIFRRAMAYYILVMAAGAALLTLLAPVAARLLAPPEYALSGALAGLFVFGQFWLGTVSILGLGIHGSRKISRIAYAYSAGAILNILLVIFLSREIGLVAAGIGSLLSGVLTALLAAHYSERTYAFRFDWSLLLVATSLSTLFAVGVYLLRAGDLGLALTPVGREALCAAGFLLLILSLAVAGDNRKILRDLRLPAGRGKAGE